MKSFVDVRKAIKSKGAISAIFIITFCTMIGHQFYSRHSSSAKSHKNDLTTDQPESEVKNAVLRNEKSKTSALKDVIVTGAGSVNHLAAIRASDRHRPIYSLFDESFMITRQASEAVGMSKEEHSAVQSATQVMIKSLQNEILRSMNEATVSEKATNYQIAAFASTGDMILSSYLERVSEILGSDRAWALAKSLPIEKIAASMGSYQVDVTITNPHPANIEGLTPEEVIRAHLIEYILIDPDSGDYIGGGSGNLEAFNRIFLNTLILSEDE